VSSNPKSNFRPFGRFEVLTEGEASEGFVLSCRDHWTGRLRNRTPGRLDCAVTVVRTELASPGESSLDFASAIPFGPPRH
jgi:hypothetical protein